MTLYACMKRAIRWGADFIQIREKDLSDAELLHVTQKAVALARGTRCRVLVNGRADIALAAGAHGLHLPSRGLQISELHPDLTRNLIVGVSTHSLAEARRAVEQGAHYIFLGPLYPTESKLRYGPPLGLTRFRRVCRAVTVPVFALGGIQPDLIPSALAAGASGIAGISLFQGPVTSLRAASVTLLSLNRKDHEDREG